MPGEFLADLDELTLKCQSNEAKAYISEAVACYRAGAFRACIITTWIAVVFDFVDKLRQLDLAGNVNARKQIENFERLVTTHDFRGSLSFENSVLEKARDDFELISHVEYEELCRLQEDRNRCAHPSMRKIAEPYQPTAETARYHIRNAVSYMLQHPPVQGKEALNRVLSEIMSPYFPDDKEAAVTYFERGPLKKPRESLVRNLVVVLLKNIVPPSTDFLPLMRQIAALKAILDMHRQWVEKTFDEKVSDLARLIPDTRLNEFMLVLYTCGFLWDYLENDIRLRLENFASRLPDDQIKDTLWWILNIPDLRKAGLITVDKLNASQLGSLIQNYLTTKEVPLLEIIDKSVSFYTASENFSGANSTGSLLIAPLAPYLSENHLTAIFTAIVDNSQIYGSNELGKVLAAIRDAEGEPYTSFAARFTVIYDQAGTFGSSHKPIRELGHVKGWI